MRAEISGHSVGSPGHRVALLRRGRLLTGGVGAACLLLAGAWYWQPGGFESELAGIVVRVVRGPFEHDVSERGELESSNNVLIRCEVQSRTAGTNGVKIIEIVPEGTNVKKGEFLIRFDDAALKSERTSQLINVGTAEATAAQSKNDLDSALIGRKGYEFGEFENEREKISGEILVASQAATHAEESVAHSRKLLRRGYIPKLAVQSDEFRLAKAESDLRAAKVRLNSLMEYTKPKKISELDAKVKTAEAKLKADEAKLMLENEKLRVLDEQIARCLVNAPVDGQVIYDHERDDWGGGEYHIKQGAVVHEQRIVIRLPDPKQMQVIAKVAESRIDRIKVGMPAKIEIEGLPGVHLEGKVTRVNEYPAAENWLSAGAKEYATTIQVVGQQQGLRPGMTAHVAIRVETIPDALQVPIQAVAERGGRHYCLRKTAGRFEPREVGVGSTNEKFLIVRSGLEAGDEVLLNPRARLDAFDLKSLPVATIGEPTLQHASLQKGSTSARGVGGAGL